MKIFMENCCRIVRSTTGLFLKVKRDEKGAAAVEFALTFPIFMGLVIFAAETARMIYTLAAISYASAEASRYVVVHKDATTEEVAAIAADNIFGLSPSNLEAIIVKAGLNEIDQTRLVTVTVQYTYEPILPVNVFLSKDYEGGFILNGVSRGFIIDSVYDPDEG